MRTTGWFGLRTLGTAPSGLMPTHRLTHAFSPAHLLPHTGYTRFSTLRVFGAFMVISRLRLDFVSCRFAHGRKRT